MASAFNTIASAISKKRTADKDANLRSKAKTKTPSVEPAVEFVAAKHALNNGIHLKFDKTHILPSDAVHAFLKNPNNLTTGLIPATVTCSQSNYSELIVIRLPANDIRSASVQQKLEPGPRSMQGNTHKMLSTGSACYKVSTNCWSRRCLLVLS